MGSTLSPFRYVQVARYAINKWLEYAPSATSKWKGKGKAKPIMRAPAAASTREGTLKYSTDADSPFTGDGQWDKATPSNASGSSSSGGGGAGPSTSRTKLQPDPRMPASSTEIYRLMNDERLLVRDRRNAPKEIIVLCHGLYGFSTATPIPLFPSLKLHYWASVLEVLRDRMGCKVMVVGVKGTGSIKERAEQMHDYLKENLPKGTGVNFVAHSMGGLDVRYLISHLKPTTYTPLSLTSIGTPHRGSPFMDWCAANIGVGTTAATAKAIAATALGSSSGKSLPFSLKAPLLSRPSKEENGSITAFTAALTSYLLNIFDSPAYGNLTTSFLRDFNPSCPDSPNVKYTSVAGRTRKMSVLHPLWFPKLVLDSAAENGYAEDEGFTGKEYEGNDGLVSVSSARWGEFLGAVDPCHHWDLRGEGGLFPTGTTLEKKPQGKPDSSAPGGWDWQGSLNEQLGLSSSTSSSSSSSTDSSSSSSSSSSAPESSMTQAKADQTQRDADKVEASLKKRFSNPSDSSWDIAQVGQVLDWVMDLLPGGKGPETEKRSMESARKEKETQKRNEERRQQHADATVGGRSGAGEKESESESEGKDAGTGAGPGAGSGVVGKRKKDEFDLARFYGGLMLKLRDDGY